MKWCVVILALGASALPVLAHRMDISATASGAELRVVVGYEGDMAAAKAQVTVYDDRKQEVAQGETDTAGVCVLAKPKAGVYTIMVDDHQGHISKTTIRIEDDGETRAQTQTMNRFAAAGLGVGLLAGMGWILRKWGAKTPQNTPA
jgi:myo-inositol-hexaphosphate 3-phosphohydrolase